MNRRPAAEIRGWHKPRFHISVPLPMVISPRRIQPPIQPPAGSISRRDAAEESTGQALVVAFQALVTRCVARAVVPSKSIRSFIPFVRMQGFHSKCSRKPDALALGGELHIAVIINEILTCVQRKICGIIHFVERERHDANVQDKVAF